MMNANMECPSMECPTVERPSMECPPAASSPVPDAPVSALVNGPANPGHELLTAHEVARWLAVSTRTVWRWVADGTLPAPVQVRKRRTRWRAQDIKRFLENLCPPE